MVENKSTENLIARWGKNHPRSAVNEGKQSHEGRWKTKDNARLNYRPRMFYTYARRCELLSPSTPVGANVRAGPGLGALVHTRRCFSREAILISLHPGRLRNPRLKVGKVRLISGSRSPFIDTRVAIFHSRIALKVFGLFTRFDFNNF